MCSKRLLPFLVLLLSVGCTVFEDRADCPCWLHLDFSSPSCSVYDTLCIMASAGSFAYCAEVPRDQYGVQHRIAVPSHDGVSLTVVPKELSSFWKEGRCLAIYGEDFPCMYCLSKLVDTSEPYVCEKVVIHKNFCRIRLFVTAPAGSTCRVSSLYGGIDLKGEPVKSAYEIVFLPDDKSGVEFRLPRQGDDSLCLSISDESGTAKNFALGQAIARSGYDWSADDLQDISLTVDYCLAGVNVSCDLWEKEIFVPIIV